VPISRTGAAIGINAAFLNIITEWLSDVKLGYCKTAFYLNESFCCWGEDNGMLGILNMTPHSLRNLGCDDWQRWSSFAPVNYVLYILFAVSDTLSLRYMHILILADNIFPGLCKPG
jgi:chloride channel 3/4/5